MTFDITGAKVPPGQYTAVLESVEILPSTNPQFPGDFRKWVFVLDVAGEATTLDASSSLNTGPGSKTRRWLTALLRRELKAGEKLDAPIGQRVIVTVADKANGYSTITEVHPFVESDQVIPGLPR